MTNEWKCGIIDNEKPVGFLTPKGGPEKGRSNMGDIPENLGTTPEAVPAPNDRIKVIEDIKYVPEADLLAIKGSLERQLGKAVTDLGTATESLTGERTKVAQLVAKQELLGADETKLTTAQQKVFDQATALSERAIKLDEREKSLGLKESDIKTMELGIKRTELATKYQLDETILKEFTDPRDMEVAALRALAERGTRPPNVSTTLVPNKGDVVLGGGGGTSAGQSSGDQVALQVINDALKRAGVSSDMYSVL